MKKYAYSIVIAFLFSLAWSTFLGPLVLPEDTLPLIDALAIAVAAALGGGVGLALANEPPPHLPPPPELAGPFVGRLNDADWWAFIFAAADWFWETDREHRFTFISDRLLTAYDLNPSNVLGRKRTELARTGSQINRIALDRHKEDLAAHRPFRDFEYCLIDGKGNERFARISGAPVFSDEGAFLGYRGFARDVTRERQSDLALRTAKEEAELANRAKTEFLANMSHELRTPLNSIIGFSDILVNETFGKMNVPQYKEYAGDINDAGKHLLQLINDLLDLARIERGQMALNEQRLDIGLVVNACHRLVRERAFDANISLMIDCPADLPPLLADELRVKQALVNLLSNAIKFTEKGGAICVTARRQDDGAVRLTVSDTGIGISPENMAVALSEFGQVDGSLARKHEGTGLGLTLARKLIELHDGQLEMESEVGKGTAAHLVFPAARSLRLPQAS
jgi:PAS domain S-box-containing protein